MVLALALLSEWRLATVVIVLESLLELMGLLAHFKTVPHLLPER